jgi:hypothetical protein
MGATSENSHKVLLRALTGRENTYRQRITPADVIKQILIEQHNNRPIRLADLLEKLVRRDSKR